MLNGIRLLQATKDGLLPGAGRADRRGVPLPHRGHAAERRGRDRRPVQRQRPAGRGPRPGRDVERAAAHRRRQRHGRRRRRVRPRRCGRRRQGISRTRPLALPRHAPHARRDALAARAALGPATPNLGTIQVGAAATGEAFALWTASPGAKAPSRLPLQVAIAPPDGRLRRARAPPRHPAARPPGADRRAGRAALVAASDDERVAGLRARSRRRVRRAPPTVGTLTGAGTSSTSARIGADGEAAVTWANSLTPDLADRDATRRRRVLGARHRPRGYLRRALPVRSVLFLRVVLHELRPARRHLVARRPEPRDHAHRRRARDRRERRRHRPLVAEGRGRGDDPARRRPRRASVPARLREHRGADGARRRHARGRLDRGAGLRALPRAPRHDRDGRGPRPARTAHHDRRAGRARPHRGTPAPAPDHLQRPVRGARSHLVRQPCRSTAPCGSPRRAPER